MTALKTNTEARLLGVKTIFQERLKARTGAGTVLPKVPDGPGGRKQRSNPLICWGRLVVNKLLSPVLPP